MEKIGTQHGFEALRQRMKDEFKEQEPSTGAQDGGPIDRAFNTLMQMRENQNELIDRLAAVEAKLAEGGRPF